MPRDKRKVDRHKTPPDVQYNSVQVTKLINKVMTHGKRSTAEGLVYKAFHKIEQDTKKDAVAVFGDAIKNVTPVLEVKARRIGGATYQIPVEVRGDRKLHLALSWLIEGAKSRKGSSFDVRLANEIMDAVKNEGLANKRKEDVHKAAEANKALAHMARY